MSDKDKANLLAILDCCTKIERFTADIENADALFAEEKTFDAVLMNFVVIGESSARITTACKERATNIPWKKIKGFRNIVAHDYFGVDAEEVWQIIHNVLPSFREEVEHLLNDL